MAGSSPRVWGQALPSPQKSRERRIIPTRMGTRVILIDPLYSTTDHPHAYGDKKRVIHVCVLLKGSSPRVWGQVGSLFDRPTLKRIIPTRMGTRSFRNYRQRTAGDHPHAYGDKALAMPALPCHSGSSPRVWGQGIPKIKDLIPTRIIPTRMGTSEFAVRVKKDKKDHPHAYGDKQRLYCVYQHDAGSSPRVWGQDLSCVPLPMCPQDHPHAYGDKQHSPVENTLA